MADVEDFNYQVLDMPLPLVLAALWYRRLRKKPARLNNVPLRVIFQSEEQLVNSVFTGTYPPESRLHKILYRFILSILDRERRGLYILEEAGVTSLNQIRIKRGEQKEE